MRALPRTNSPLRAAMRAALGAPSGTASRAARERLLREQFWSGPASVTRGSGVAVLPLRERSRAAPTTP